MTNSFTIILHYISVVTITLLQSSCQQKDVLRTPGLSLSFDDRSVNEWFQLREMFSENEVRVTFFITQPDSLDNEDLAKLKMLESDGHEIGFHGNLHVLSESYIKKSSYSQYLRKEIDMGIEKMDSLGFRCVSFAYPFGAKYWFTDYLLLEKFDFLRGVSALNEEKDLSKMDEIYYSYDDDQTLSAMGIDINSGLEKSMIDEALNRALKEKEVLLLYGHVPSINNNARGYAFNIELLNHIIKTAKAMNFDFYTIKELNTKAN